MMGKARRGWLRGEGGQSLVVVLILLVVGALIIAPLLAFVGTGIMVGQKVYEAKPKVLPSCRISATDHELPHERRTIPTQKGLPLRLQDDGSAGCRRSMIGHPEVQTGW